MSRRKYLVRMLKDRKFRDAFVSEGIDTSVPLQIRANREARGLTQRELAEHMGTKQVVVSRIENINYGKMTLTTLKGVAAAFDIALLVRFVPFSRLISEIEAMESDGMVVPSFDEERTDTGKSSTTEWMDLSRFWIDSATAITKYRQLEQFQSSQEPFSITRVRAENSLSRPRYSIESQPHVN